MDEQNRSLPLGAFSVSLTVKDLQASRAFYEKLGFSVIAGEAEHRYLIMRNGTTSIGLFQGMFERNILTFNPGWDAECNTLDGFEDVRALMQRLRDRGLTLEQVNGEGETGPGSFVVVDPDGNPILIDQHVPKP